MTDYTVIRYGTDSLGRGIYMTRFMQEWVDDLIEWCKKRGFEPTIVQGAFMTRNGRGAVASAGYHDLGGCLDFRSRDLTDEQIGMFVRECRRRGAAAWLRDQKHGGMDPHVHLVLGCDKPLASGAAWQWSEYLAGRDGLASQGRDYHWRPDPLVTTWAPPAPKPKPTPNITAALRAPDATARKIALRKVARHGSPAARKAARAWLKTLLELERVRAESAARRAALKEQEVR